MQIVPAFFWNLNIAGDGGGGAGQQPEKGEAANKFPEAAGREGWSRNSAFTAEGQLRLDVW